MAADEGEVIAIMAEQRRELEIAKALESDLDAAFRLQMQEAVAASLAVQHSSTSPHPSSSSVLPLLEEDNSTLEFLTLQSEEMARFLQDKADRECVDAVMQSEQDDLKRRMHDQRLASDILQIPEDEWMNTGDYFQRPFSEKCSRSFLRGDECFLVYSKGLVRGEGIVKGEAVVAGIGVAICDPMGNLIFEKRKTLEGDNIGRDVADLQALIESLNTALILKLESVRVHCDDHLTYLHITGRWQSQEGKIAELVHQVDLLQKKFKHCNTSLVNRNDVKVAYKLARDAIPPESTRGKNILEACEICLEAVDTRQMLSVDDCQHRYCVLCLRQHIVVKLGDAKAPGCPHVGCKSELSIDSCSKFLTSELVELMRLRIKEASIPASDKVYCPQPHCSALMTASEVLDHSKKTLNTYNTGCRECLKCHRQFCVKCMVPWHANMSCAVYLRLNPFPSSADAKLKRLAQIKRWRQCVKCNNMVELVTGCYHIYCRCGYEFCYTCGAEWKNRKATCSCPIWDERNILYNDDRRP